MFGWGTFEGKFAVDQQWKLIPVATKSNHFRIQNVMHDKRFLLKPNNRDIYPKKCSDGNCDDECEEGKKDCDQWIIQPLYAADEEPEYRDVFFFDNDQDQNTTVTVKLSHGIKTTDTFQFKTDLALTAKVSAAFSNSQKAITEGENKQADKKTSGSVSIEASMAFSHLSQDSSSQNEDSVHTFKMKLYGGEKVKLVQPVYKFHRRDGQGLLTIAPKFYQFVNLTDNETGAPENGDNGLISKALYKIVNVKYPHERLSYTSQQGLRTENTLKQFPKQIWKLNDVGDGNWMISNKALDDHRLAIYDNFGLQVTAADNKKHHQWKIIPLAESKYRIQNIAHDGQYLYKSNEESIDISSIPSNDESDQWIFEPILKVNSKTEFMDEFFRFDNLGEVATWVDVEVTSGISTTLEVSDEDEVKTSVTAGLHQSSESDDKTASMSQSLELGLSFGLAFTDSIAKMESLEQKTNIRIKVQPGESVRLEQPVAFMTHVNEEDIFQLKSDRIRRVKGTLDDRRCSSKSDQESSETESVDDTGLVSGGLYVIENADLKNYFKEIAEEFVGDSIGMLASQLPKPLKVVADNVGPMVSSLLGDIINTETGGLEPLWVGIAQNGEVRSYNDGYLTDKQIWKLQQEGDYWYIINHSDDVTRITVKNNAIDTDAGEVTDSQKWKLEKHGNNWWNFEAPIDEREYQISNAGNFCTRNQTAIGWVVDQTLNAVEEGLDMISNLTNGTIPSLNMTSEPPEPEGLSMFQDDTGNVKVEAEACGLGEEYSGSYLVN